MVCNIAVVFHEVGSKKDYFVISIKDGMEDVIHGGCGTDCHADSFRTDLHACFLAALLCYDLACGRITCIRHIAVHTGSGVLGQVLKSIEDFLRRLQVGIADREVIYIVSAVDSLKSAAFFEHLTDLGAALKSFSHFLGNHSNTSYE